MRTKVELYAPERGVYSEQRAMVRIAGGVPGVGDLVHAPALAPAAGPGAHEFVFRVTARRFSTDQPPLLTVMHLRNENEGLL